MAQHGAVFCKGQLTTVRYKKCYVAHSPSSLSHTQILFGPPPLFWRCTQRFESCQHLLLFRTYVLCSSTNNYNMFPVNSLNTVLFSWLFLAQSPFVPVSSSKKRFVWRIVTPLYFLAVVILMAIPSGRSCAWIVWRTSQSSLWQARPLGLFASEPKGSTSCWYLSVHPRHRTWCLWFEGFATRQGENSMAWVFATR